MRRFLLMSLAGVFALVLLGAGPASAQYVGVTPPIVGPTDVGGPEGGIDTSVLGAQFRTTPPVVGVTPSPGANVAVLGGAVTRGGVAPQVQVLPQVQVQGAQVRRLVVTGADIATLSLMALALVVAGTLLVRRARRAEG